MQFEIRLVVWEVYNVSKPVGRDIIDIYISISLDPDANKDGIEVTKQTDTHCGSENGNGVYNFRFIFYNLIIVMKNIYI